MNKNMSQEDFENIEKYINGKLQGVALSDFETRLKEDKLFANAVEEQKIVQEVIEEQHLRKHLDVFHKALEGNQTDTNEPTSGKLIKMTSWLKYGLVASIALIVGWLGFNYLANNDKGNQDASERLFAAHFTPDPGLPTTMSAVDNYAFFEAMVSYKMKDYQSAISKWQPLLEEKPNNDTLNYFLGVANLAYGNEDEAITFLQWAAEHQDSHFLRDAYHYLGLAHLKNGDEAKAVNALEKSSLKKSKALLEKIAPSK